MVKACQGLQAIPFYLDATAVQAAILKVSSRERFLTGPTNAVVTSQLWVQTMHAYFDCYPNLPVNVSGGCYVLYFLFRV